MTVHWHPAPWLLALSLALTLTACLDTRQVAPADPAAHPLVNQIWSTGAQAFITMDTLQDMLADADYVLLGENHDNPAHHQLQAQIIAALPWSQATVGFEQINSDQAPALEAWLENTPHGTAGLDTALNWAQSGWPEWALYEPVFAALRARGWRPLDLMFPAANTRAVFSEGLGAVLEADLVERLQPDTLFTAEQRLAMAALMADAHCGHMPAEHMQAMVDVQIARDAYMARRLASSGERAVVITGNGHARRDWGVPVFLQRLRPQAKIVTVTLTEVAADRREPGLHATAQPGWSDVTVFTPAHDRGDPCAGLAKAASPAPVSGPSAQREPMPGAIGESDQ